MSSSSSSLTGLWTNNCHKVNNINERLNHSKDKKLFIIQFPTYLYLFVSLFAFSYSLSHAILHSLENLMQSRRWKSVSQRVKTIIHYPISQHRFIIHYLFSKQQNRLPSSSYFPVSLLSKRASLSTLIDDLSVDNSWTNHLL
jgi:hypothetical protein